MFFDLGLAGDHQRAVVAASSRMGYDCVAVCHRITGVPRASDRYVVNKPARGRTRRAQRG